MKISNSILSLVVLGLGLVLAEYPQPATDGRFFYVDMESGGSHSKYDDHGTHFVDLLVGGNVKQFSLGINTQIYYLAIVAENEHSPGGTTRNYNVDNYYDPTYSWTSYTPKYQFQIDKRVQEEATIRSNDLGAEKLVITNLTMTHVGEYVKFQQSRYERETSINITMALVDSSSKEIFSEYDGFIGIQPYQVYTNYKEANFMWQLTRGPNAIIDHSIVMVNMQSHHGNSSVIKFGSWDKSAIQGEKLTMLQTHDHRLWLLRGYQLWYGDVELKDGMEITNTRHIILSPHLPYMYLPDDDYNVVSAHMKLIYPTVICDAQSCRFPQACQHYDDDSFKVVAQDGVAHTFDLVTPDNTTFIDGESIGDNSDSCYLPFFKSRTGSSLHGEEQVDTWYIGAMFLNHYVIVYDNTQYDEENISQLLIGLAPKATNEVWEQMDELYNTNSADYHPNKIDDASHVIGTDPGPCNPAPGGNCPDPDDGDHGGGDDPVKPDPDDGDNTHNGGGGVPDPKPSSPEQSWIQKNLILFLVIVCIVVLLCCLVLYKCCASSEGGGDSAVSSLFDGDKRGYKGIIQ